MDIFIAVYSYEFIHTTATRRNLISFGLHLQLCSYLVPNIVQRHLLTLSWDAHPSIEIGIETCLSSLKVTVVRRHKYYWIMTWSSMPFRLFGDRLVQCIDKTFWCQHFQNKLRVFTNEKTYIWYDIRRNVNLPDLWQAHNWHTAGRKTGHGRPDFARWPPVWHPCL